MNQKIIAVDFDGTMCRNEWPGIGEANEEVINYIVSEKQNGAKLILWTNRSGKNLDEAVVWAKEHGVEFDAVNDNLPESVEYFGGNSRKIYATEFIDDRATRMFRLPYTGKEFGGMTEWARREIDIACKRENPDWKPGTFDYGCSCYASALKAFMSLMDDGHSGFSFSITRQILIRLMNNNPLTPIEDTGDIWGLSYCNEDRGFEEYQCKRKSSFFKRVYSDGRVEYHDNDRYFCQDKDDPRNTYSGGVGRQVFEEMFPITSMPYIPDDQKYKVITSEGLYDPKHGDFDFVAVWKIVKPDGEIVEVNRFFAEDESGFVEISRAEFDTYCAIAEARKANESAN